MPPNSARVTNAVRAPRSAARSAASTPAGPPPITTTSIKGCRSHTARRRTRFGSMSRAQVREVSKRLDAGQEEVGSASYGREGRQTGDLFPDRALRDLVLQRAVMVADDRISLIAELVETLVVGPDVLGELELADETRADHEGGDPALHAILRGLLRQMRAVRGPTAD